ncbi:MAG: type I restriction-modification system subunit M N-terminal domain-containing protein, partial [Mariprofundales bacterium]|nr:type I restriction-modification system subunit M N-terminal domain-containing protein [Mariprofundales bacterium]
MATDNHNFEAALFKTADKLRKNIDAAEYKNVVLGLIFLKYISDSFQELHKHLAQDAYSDPEDRDEYVAENIFFVPEIARWNNLQAKAKLPEIGVALDHAMEAIEKENAELKHVLSKVYDPACGSGGMFVMSEKFVEEHQGNVQDITIYGQEPNQTTWKLSKMNLAIRNINSQFVAWNTEGSFLKDMHPDLKA